METHDVVMGSSWKVTYSGSQRPELHGPPVKWTCMVAILPTMDGAPNDAQYI